jgi:hypothetical protein
MDWKNVAGALLRPVIRKDREDLWKRLEEHFNSHALGFFSGLSVTFEKTLTHTGLLSWLYLSTSIGFLVVTVYLWVSQALGGPQAAGVGS